MAVATESDFTALYRANYADLRRFVCRRVPPDLADDIVGETFLAAWRHRAKLPDDPRPWLFGAARNVMLNADRSIRRQRAVAVRIADHAGGVGGGGDPGHDPAGAVDTRIDLADAWRRLSARDQEVLALRIWDDLDDRAAATVLGCTRATYTMRLSRARRRLARLAAAESTSSPFVPTAIGVEHP